MINIFRKPTIVSSQKRFLVPATEFTLVTPGAHDISANNGWPSINLPHGSVVDSQAMIPVPDGAVGLNSIQILMEDNNTGNVKITTQVAQWEFANAAIDSVNSPGAVASVITTLTNSASIVAFSMPATSWLGLAAFTKNRFLQCLVRRNGNDAQDTSLTALAFVGILCDFQ